MNTVSIEQWGDDAEDAIRGIMLRSYADSIKYRHLTIVIGIPERILATHTVMAVILAFLTVILFRYLPMDGNEPVFVLSLGAPIAQGTLILYLVTLLLQIGIDISVISLVIGINFILEMLLGVVNSVGDVVIALLVARREGTLDLNAYRKL